METVTADSSKTVGHTSTGPEVQANETEAGIATTSRKKPVTVKYLTLS